MNLKESDLNNLPLTENEEGYNASEMVGCRNCRRENPPNRLECIYCGTELSLTDEQRRAIGPVLGEVDEFESAINIVRVPGAGGTRPEDLAPVTRTLGKQSEELRAAFAAMAAVPLARTASESSAELFAEQLKEAGVSSLLVRDEELDPTRPPLRLRGLRITDEGVSPVPFNRIADIELIPVGIGLIVIGGFFRNEIETTEKRSRRKENGVVESAEMSEDEVVLDIYPTGSMFGYRILTTGFDFSCLGSEMDTLASRNIRLLANRLQRSFPDARTISGYRELMPFIDDVWPRETRKDSIGLKPKRFGGYLRQFSMKTDNSEQFTKFSKLQALANSRLPEFGKNVGG